MIKFTCSACNRRLKAPESKAGIKLPCPSCSKELVVPSSAVLESTCIDQSIDGPSQILDWISGGESSPRQDHREAPPLPETESPPLPETKQCPFCAESIQYAAQKCRFCSEFLDGRTTQIREQPTSHVASPSHQKLRDPGVAAVLSFIIPGLGYVYLGRIGLGILAGIICTFLYVGGFNEGSLSFLVLGMVFHILLICGAYSDVNRLNQSIVNSERNPEPRESSEPRH